jgi:hypothetical protein
MKPNDENKTLLSMSLAYKLSDVFDSCVTADQYESALSMYHLAKKYIKDNIENEQTMEDEIGYFMAAMCMYFNQREKTGYFVK